MQFQEKLMNQTWENGKKPSFGINFGPFDLNLSLLKNRWWILSCYMLDIVVSYYYMKFHGKLTNQTWENGNKPSLGTDFGLFDPNSGHQKFSHRFYLYNMLDIVARYHCMQFQRQLINQIWENGKNIA